MQPVHDRIAVIPAVAKTSELKGLILSIIYAPVHEFVHSPAGARKIGKETASISGQDELV